MYRKNASAQTYYNIRKNIMKIKYINQIYKPGSLLKIVQISVVLY